jgi:hypothetical protein
MDVEEDLECCTCSQCRGKLVPRGTGLIHATRTFIERQLAGLRLDMTKAVNDGMDTLRREMHAAINRAMPDDSTIIDFEELRRNRTNGSFTGHRET